MYADFTQWNVVQGLGDRGMRLALLNSLLRPVLPDAPTHHIS